MSNKKLSHLFESVAKAVSHSWTVTSNWSFYKHSGVSLIACPILTGTWRDPLRVSHVKHFHNHDDRWNIGLYDMMKPRAGCFPYVPSAIATYAYVDYSL
jgi:hypothetical protein